MTSRETPSLAIIMYHYVREIEGSAFPGIKGLELDGFRHQLDFLGETFNFATAEQLIATANGDDALPDNPCLLTFDDGYKDHYVHVLPELLQRGIQGSFFPPVKPVVVREILDVNRVHFILACADDPVTLAAEAQDLCREHGVSDANLAALWEDYAVANRFDGKHVIFIKRLLQHALPEAIRNAVAETLFSRYVSASPQDFAAQLYLSVDETRDLVDAGMYVGSHGYKHLWLDRETRAGQEQEITRSLAFLEDVGAPTADWIMCYPYGGYNADTLEILGNRGCKAGLTAKVGAADLGNGMLLELARWDTNDFPQ